MILEKSGKMREMYSLGYKIVDKKTKSEVISMYNFLDLYLKD